MTPLRSSRRILLLASGLLLLFTACASFVGLFVSQRDAIRVTHQRHLEAEVDCGTCHENIFDSTNFETANLPKEKKCLGCHKEEKEKGNCAFCHSNPERPAQFATRVRELKMNHAEHLGRVKDDCTVCHKVLPEPFRTEGMAPKMEACLSCHEHAEQYESGQCQVCHNDLTKYKLRPTGDFSHRVDWVKSHKTEARSAQATCSNCHEQTFCSECHAKTVATRVEYVLPERVDRAFIHRHDFLSRHALEAQADEASCQRCHGLNFCQSCHQKNSLKSGSAGNLDPHPSGFGNGLIHGPAARRDIVSCAACHDQGAASNCVSCHRVGGVGGNPHPPTWMIRHSKEEVGRNAMCQVCHL